jgi:ATP-dependent protease ClpP protease subunit
MPKQTKTKVSFDQGLLLEHGIDNVHHQLFLVGPVDDDMYQRTALGLQYLNTIGEGPLSGPAIRVILSTTGGDVSSAFAIYDLFKANSRPVDILVNGPCMSSGTLILQAARDRAATPHSSFLIHYGSRSADSHSEAEYDRRMHEKWVDLMADRAAPRTSRHDMDLLHRGETYLTAPEALMHGIIDRIVEGR